MVVVSRDVYRRREGRGDDEQMTRSLEICKVARCGPAVAQNGGTVQTFSKDMIEKCAAQLGGNGP